jgi:2,3-bisphosphoglycerate-independent phosphoglycerate mutase
LLPGTLKIRLSLLEVALKTRPRHIALVFIDGLGYGPDDPDANPCLTYGGDFFDFSRPAAHRKPIDACLGVNGIPQSATGQTTLLTGINAQKEIGGHQTGFPTPSLRRILLQHSIFRQLRDIGCDGIFLNAFRPAFFEISRELQMKLSATTVAHLAADRPFFTLDDIGAGRSIYQEFTNRELIDRGFDVKPMTPQEAGAVLARNIPLRDFTLFEYFQSDHAGHSQDQTRIEGELKKLEAFMDQVLKELGEAGRLEDTLLLLTSDHGNLEDLTTRSHTRNPIPLMAWGCGADSFLESVGDLQGVTPEIIRLLR